MRKLPQEIARDRRAARRASAAIGLLLLLGTSGAALALPGGGGIRLDGTLIPADEVWGEYSYQTRARDMIHPRAPGTIDTVVFRTASEVVLQRNILAREAGRRGISLSEQERAALREMQVAAWKGEANYRMAIAMLGVSEAFLMRQMEMNQLSRKLAEVDVQAQGVPSEANLLGYYRENPARYPGTSAALRYLLLPVGWTREQITAVTAEADVLRKEGRDYESLVRRFSIHGSAAAGGIVPEGSGGAWPHGELAQGLQPGRVSDSRRSEAGVHVYVRDPKLPLPFESVRGRVVADLHELRIAMGLRSLAEGLRQAAKVEFLEGAAPAGVIAPSPAGHR